MKATLNSRSIAAAFLLFLSWGTAVSAASSGDPIELWTTVHQSPGTGFVGVAAGEGRIVAVDGNGKIISWPQTNSAQKVTVVTRAPLRGITHGAGRFMVVGWEGQILTSTNGVDWVSAGNGEEDYNLSEVVFGNGIFLAQGGLILLRSTNGRSWSPQPQKYSWSSGIYFGGGLFIMPKTPGTNLISSDGLNWNEAPSGTTNGIYSIGYGNDRFIAFDHRNQILTSPDAVTWTKHGTLTDVRRPVAVAEGNGFLLTGGGNSQAYSRDGIHWKVIPTNTHNGQVIFANGVFLSAGYQYIQQSGPIVSLLLESPGSLSLLAKPNAAYRIESTEKLSTNTQWDLQETLITPSTGMAEWSDPRPANVRSRFYRALPKPE